MQFVRVINKSSLPMENLHFWMNGDYGGGLTPADGTIITSVVDKSGNGFTLSSGNTNPVVYRTNGINGQPSYETRTSYLSNNSFNLPQTDTLTLFIVLKRDVAFTGSYGSAFNLTLSQVSAGVFLQINTLGGNYNLNYFSAPLDQANIHVADTNPLLIAIVKSPTQSSVYVNGVFIATNTGTQNINASTIGLGSWGGNFFNGQFGECIIYNEAVNTSKLNQVTDLLLTKYSI